MMVMLVGAVSALTITARAEEKERLNGHFKDLYGTFGRNSTTKVKILSGPENVKMRNNGVPGKRWTATDGKYVFKLTIHDEAKCELDWLVKLIEKLPGPYMRACEAVSDEKEDGIAVYPSLGGATAHGGKQYINIVPRATARTVAHEAGHTLEQVARESITGLIDKWEAAIKSDNISVSRYGDNVSHEDLAEFALAYAVCLDGGPKYLSELRKLSPGRFALWEKILMGSNTLLNAAVAGEPN